MVDNGSIDNVIYPQHTTIGKILSQVRQGNISSVHSLLRGKAEALEVIIQSNEAKNTLAGKTIRDIKLPDGSLVIGLVRKNIPLPTKQDVVVNEGDHLIIFIADKSLVHQVELLFKPTKSLLSRLIK
jgi:trk system potassium uptake protein TrkA